MIFTNTRLGNFAKDPAVVNFGGTYFIYYTVHYRVVGENKIGVGIASSADMEHWADLGEIPMEQDCEKNGIGAPAAIVLDGKVHLFYQTYGNGRLDAICHAVSADGVHFEKNPTNPVFRPAPTWCCGRAIDADVCIFGGQLLLYFATRDHEMKIQKVGAAAASPDSGFVRDAWRELHIGAVMAPELLWEQQCIEAPAVLVRDEKIYMFYAGAYNCAPQQIGCAVSEDGVRFERLFVEPLLRHGPAGAWNASESGHPYIFEDNDGRVYLFYQGSPDGGKTWYLSRAEIGFDAAGVPFVKELFDGEE